MNIIYPKKTSLEVLIYIQKYEEMSNKSKKFPLWWIFIEILWRIVNICIVLFGFKPIFLVLTPILSQYFFDTDMTNFIHSFFVTAIIMYFLISLSWSLRKLVQGTLFPESKNTENYLKKIQDLRKLHTKYENIEDMKKKEYDNITFRIKKEANSCVLCISTIKDGFIKDFNFAENLYKISKSEDDTNIIDLSVFDRLVDNIVTVQDY